jgi:probable F420-dependent oxidoreductase
MKLGVTFPQTEIGADPAAIREYVQTVEGLGYDYLLAYDHVLGANPERPGGWNGPYTYLTMFHEVFVLFGYLAAISERLELMTGVLILPQRQTALVAKQAAEIDVLSRGRLHLGVGLGWNEVEYESLNEDFHNRGKRIEEQIALMRELWAKPLVTFKGAYHSIPDAGLNPLPQRSIPIWFGGRADAALRRTAKLGDGWIANIQPAERLKPEMEKLRGYLREAGRDPAQFGLETHISIARTPQGEWAQEADRLKAVGATRLGVDTMRAGFTSLEQHLYAIRRFKAEVSG